MNQVGETKTFTLSVVPPAESGVYAYIWKFWDGSVAATTTPTVTKKLNVGGDPANSRLLYYTCEPVMEDGRSITITGQIEVNNPPDLVPSPMISNNDQYFPYQTDIALTAYDPDNDPLTFKYYDDGTLLGQGVSTSVGVVNGTWNGTQGSFNGTRNVFSTTIQSEQTVTLLIYDDQGGTRSLDFPFFGEVAPAPTIGVTADPDSITADASSVPDQRIGPGQFVTFNVYAADPVSNDFEFLWSFFGSYGWATTSFTNGTSTVQPDGSVRNNYEKDIENESGGDKRVVIRVTNVTSGQSTEFPISVTLVANEVATSGTITMVDQNGNAVAPEATVASGTKLEITAVVVDPNNDIINYKWTITQPSGIHPAILRAWGPKIVLDTTDWPAASQVVGTVTAYDRMQGAVSLTLPVINIS